MDLPATIHLLGETLGAVLRAQESTALFATEETVRGLAKARRAGDPASGVGLADAVAVLSVDAARATASAFAVYFDLVNLAEESHRIHTLRARRRSLHPAPIAESVGATVGRLKAQGVSPARMAELLATLRIELVLTAHPTEAKRRTVLSKLQRVGELLRRLRDEERLPDERAADGAALRAEITALWLTDRARTTRPAVTDEVRTGLYFVESIFWDALPRLAADLDDALRAHFPELASPPRWLTLASWIGGDRDGNPSVVTAVTAETLRLHRGLAVERHRRSLREAARRLSLSGRRCPPPPALVAWLEARRPLPPRVAYLEERYANEPYRLALSLLAADLEAASEEDMTARLLEEAPHQARATGAEIARVLDLIAGALPPEVAADALGALRAQMACFGLHAARLDIREDSGRIAVALEGILAGLGHGAAGAGEDEPARARRLLALLAAEAAQARGRAGGGARGARRRDVAALPPHRARSGRVRARVARAFHHLDDARPRRRAGRAPPRPVGGVRGGARHRPPLRDPGRSGRRPGHSRGPVRPARLSRASRRRRRRADDHDRLLGQQQGRRLPRRDLGALPRAGVHRARLR